MTELNTIKGEIASAREEITEAATVSDQARGTASDAAEYYANLGLEGVYSELHAVAEKLETAVAQHNTAGDAVDTATNALHEVSDKTKIPETVKQLGEAAEQLNSAMTALETGASEAEEALARAQAVEHEETTNHALAAVNAAAKAQSAVETARTKTNEYQAKIQPGNR